MRSIRTVVQRHALGASDAFARAYSGASASTSRAGMMGIAGGGASAREHAEHEWMEDDDARVAELAARENQVRRLRKVAVSAVDRGLLAGQGYFLARVLCVPRPKIVGFCVVSSTTSCCPFSLAPLPTQNPSNPAGGSTRSRRHTMVV
jgi:hypothetical protein